MGITPEEFVSHYPRLYHMAELGTWSSIRSHGLLSTSALLDLYGINGKERRQIECCRRPQSVTIRHEKYGPAVIRDQKPISDSALSKCLEGMTPTEWYRLLNERVFFWVARERVLGLLSARTYRNREHTVLTIDTAKLLKLHHERVTLSPINSGSTVYNPQPRGPDTFQTLGTYPFEKWQQKRRSATKAVAELAVGYSVPNIRELVLRVERRKQSRILEVIYER
jgi:Family of unknown function (DUF7002)